jgi:hypothetical protein
MNSREDCLKLVDRFRYVIVGFEPVVLSQEAFVWAVVRFPGGSQIQSSGLTGGAGIGWISTPTALGQRSFYSVDGLVAEFTAGLDIELVLDRLAKAGAETGWGNGSPSFNNQHRNRGDPDLRGVTLTTVGVGRLAQVTFQLEKHGDAQVVVFDVVGRRVCSLMRAFLETGVYSLTWDGRDEHGEEVSNGMYFVVLLAGDQRVASKLLLMR